MSEITSGIITVLLAIIGVAIIAVLISPQAQTGSVINAGASGFSSILSSALSPVTSGGLGFAGGPVSG